MGTANESSQTDEETSIKNSEDITVVDADMHFYETVDDYIDYLDGERFKGEKELLGRTVKMDGFGGTEQNLTLDPTFYLFSNAYATHPDPYAEVVSDGTAAGNAEAMERFNIDYSITVPTMTAGITGINNDRYAMALANAYNSWALDQVADYEGMKIVGMVAPQAPDKAAEEIDRIGDEDDVAALGLPPTGLIPPAGHQLYDPIYDAASRHGLPIFMHSSVASTAKGFPNQYQWSETYAEDHVNVHPMSQIWQLTSLLFNGVPERYPDLNFLVIESGIGWVPYMRWRLDDHYLEYRYELPYLEQKPSKYMDDQWYFGTQPMGEVERYAHYASLIEMVGEDSVMFASDIPHNDFDHPDEMVRRLRSHFDADTVRGAMGETAIEAFRL